MIKRIAITCTGILLVVFSASIFADSPEDALNGYIAALKAEDWSKARSFWDEAYLQSTERLGIQYTDVPCKYDCASAIYWGLEGIQSGEFSVNIISTTSDANSADVELTLERPWRTDTLHYYAIQSDSGWKLTSPYMQLRQQLKMRETQYCRIYYSDPRIINSSALLDMDRFIESTCEQLGVTPKRIQNLSRIKIDYYLVDDTTIKLVTGYQPKGMYDIPSDAIISVRLPHRHELTHLLVNYALEQPSLYTLPFLQEGLACHFGGRWGRSPGVIKYSGYISLQFGLIDPEYMFSSSDFIFGFGMGTAEAMYPISSLFVGYLIQRLGMAEFLNLYRSLSGTSSFVHSLTRDQIEEKISNHLELPWPKIQEDFAAYWHRYARYALYPFDTQLPVDTALVRIEDTVPVKIWSVADTYLFEVDLSKAPKGGILLFTSVDSDADDYRSPLYGEHLPASDYQGEHFGIRCTPAEVGVYDYYCNDLLASLIYGCDPDGDLISAADSIYRFTVSKTVFGIEDITGLRLSVRVL